MKTAKEKIYYDVINGESCPMTWAEVLEDVKQGKKIYEQNRSEYTEKQFAALDEVYIISADEEEEFTLSQLYDMV